MNDTHRPIDEPTVFARVREVVAKILNVPGEKVARETRFVDDLGADSVDRALLLMELETAFDREIPQADAQGLTSVQKVIDYVLHSQQP